MLSESRCSQTEFICGDGSCINYNLRCDGKQDCLVDRSDEENCPDCGIDETWFCDGNPICQNYSIPCNGECRDYTTYRCGERCISHDNSSIENLDASPEFVIKKRKSHN